MAAPSTPGTPVAGVTDAGGAWTFTPDFAGSAAGNVIIVQIFQDGATTGAVTVTGASNIENLAGTDNAWTTIVADSPCGSPTSGLQHLFIGRLLSTTDPTISGGNSTSEDVYIQAYMFTNVNTGTTLSDVLENSSAGSTVNAVGTGTSITDTGVTTLGSDRLALNFVGADDDATGLNGATMTGMSGGTWDPFRGFESSTGTDGSVYVANALMSSAGTINGGSFTTAISVGWGNIGFALIGTTSGGGTTYTKAGYGKESG